MPRPDAEADRIHMAPFSTDLAPRFQVNDATMRRSDWWKGGHVGVETILTKK